MITSKQLKKADASVDFIVLPNSQYSEFIKLPRRERKSYMLKYGILVGSVKNRFDTGFYGLNIKVPRLFQNGFLIAKSRR